MTIVRRLFIASVGRIAGILLWKLVAATLPGWILRIAVLVALQILIRQILDIPALDEMIVAGWQALF